MAITEPLIHDNQGVHLSLDLRLKNVGVLPAIQTYFAFKVFLGGFKENALNTVCSSAEQDNLAVSVFPGDAVEESLTDVIPQSDIDIANANWKRYQFPTIPGVIVCIAYKIPGDSVFHHTPYFFWFVMADHSRYGCCTIPLNEPDLPPGTVAIDRLPLADFGSAD